MYAWIVFLHVLGGMTFFLAHGASASVDFKIRQETQPDRIRALLDVSAHSLNVLFASLLVLLGAGIAAGFVGHWWRFGWIWVSLALLVGTSGFMSWYSRRRFTALRKAAGLAYMEGNKPHPAEPPLGDDDIAARAAAVNPVLSTAVGYGALVIILWLMMFKPF